MASSIVHAMASPAHATPPLFFGIACVRYGVVSVCALGIACVRYGSVPVCARGIIPRAPLGIVCVRYGVVSVCALGILFWYLTKARAISCLADALSFMAKR
ncbi:MAG: hypothetical protein K0U66_02765 [Gammaproteobacteria bacterium]|nr:hypothetical protein [Gammaproteobacteria bacterium]